ncbi:MAG: hypothetical protein AAF570_21855, partial [Bacteroidota bacterium]
NPIIFYRSVEQSFGSPDNSTIGVSLKTNFLQRFQFYGQIMLDDFNFRNRDQGTGYFANKYGYQVGLKYINAFWIPLLDLQVEYNRVRPYTYSHFNPTASYSHYGQPLAHGAGANLYDVHLLVRYQPFPRWSGRLLFSHMYKGLDMDGYNFGGDIFQPYTLNRPPVDLNDPMSPVRDFGNLIGQGDPLTMTMVHGRISYRLFKLDAYADLELRYRKENENSSVSVLGALRLNMPARDWRF